MSAIVDRPAEFDRRVMQYLPGLKKLARKFTRTIEERDDLVTDTIAKALEDWQKFRDDGGFWNWLYWTMRGIARNRVHYARAAIRQGTLVPFDTDDPVMQARFSTAPAQDVELELADVTRLVTHVRHGDLLMRYAHGATLNEIAKERGVSRERIRQLVAAARAELELRR